MSLTAGTALLLEKVCLRAKALLLKHWLSYTKGSLLLDFWMVRGRLAC